MLDIRYILDNFDEVSLRLRGRDESIDLNQLRELDAERRKAIRETESLQALRNATSREIGAKKKRGEDMTGLMAEMKATASRVAEMEAIRKKAQEALNAALEVLPNIPIDPTPLIPDKSGNRVLREWGEFRSAQDRPFPFKNHLEIGESLEGLDFSRAAKMTGSGWPLYRGGLAHLEWALVWFLIERAVSSGRELILPPFLVNTRSMFSSGQYPKFRNEAYECRDDDLVLMPTSEVALLNLYRDEILPDEMLPLRLAAYTPCFRREAGTYGAGERGLIRIHQFNKVEIFALTRPQESSFEFESMIKHAESIMEKLELPYRTTLLAAGDIAQQAACTCDVEVWLPGQNAFSEVSSVSNCTDYQARRGSIRYRPAGSKKPEFVHTLNGSALATSRLMVAIMEQNQLPDGGLSVPGALRAYMAGRERIDPPSRG